MISAICSGAKCWRTRRSLVNKSNINILTASSKSVRGPHPQKLKLDEIDEFDDKIYEAAMPIPKTKKGIKASVQIYSTMHKAYGLMNRVITEAAQSGYKIYKWCVFDVMEKCVGRECSILRTLGGLPGPGLGCRRLLQHRDRYFRKAARSPGTPGSRDALFPCQARKA